MNKLFFAALTLIAILFTSCGNDDIDIETPANVNPVNVTVSLSKFFSGYNYNDTKHNVTLLSDYYRSFNSEYELYIQTRVLFYNSNGFLVDSIINYSTNTNVVNKTIKLAEGKYTAIATLAFASKTDGYDSSNWWLVDKENLNSAYLDGPYPGQSVLASTFMLLSYASQEITVEKGKSTELSLTPTPVGSMVYCFYENFQYRTRTDLNNNNIADNKVRKIGILTQNFATGYKLNPNASDRYIYQDDAGMSSWWYLNHCEPSDFNYTFFQKNIYGYFYILAPKCSIVFGYMKEGDTGFSDQGMATYNITNGQTYLAYWDWLQVGNPYFGKADNNHWHSYANSPAVNPTWCCANAFLDKSTERILQNQQ